MADFIDLAKPLKLATPGKAPIAGLTVANIAALEAIDSPWLGMVVYVEADGKTYRITELKDVSLGAFTKKAVSKYETVPDKTDLEGKAPANHQHTLSDLSDLSELENQFAAADHQHTLSDLSDLPDMPLRGGQEGSAHWFRIQRTVSPLLPLCCSWDQHCGHRLWPEGPHGPPVRLNSIW